MLQRQGQDLHPQVEQRHSEDVVQGAWSWRHDLHPSAASDSQILASRACIQYASAHSPFQGSESQVASMGPAWNGACAPPQSAYNITSFPRNCSLSSDSTVKSYRPEAHRSKAARAEQVSVAAPRLRSLKLENPTSSRVCCKPANSTLNLTPAIPILMRVTEDVYRM